MRRALLLLLLALPACDSFRPASLVESLRVLALRAEPAEIGSGEQATIRSLVVDLDAAPDAITYEWALCDKRPKVGVDVDPDCYDLDTADFLVPLPSLPGGTTQVTMPQRTVGDFGLPDPSGGFYVPVRLRVTAGGTRVTAFHRLRWKAGFVPPNENPTLAGIGFLPTGVDGDLPDLGPPVDPQPLVDGTPFEAPLGGKIRLRASDAPGSSESYTTIIGDPRDLRTGTVTEGVRFFWYLSAGKADPDVSGEARPDAVVDTTTYPESIAPRGGLVDVWLVAREERGGVDFLHRQLLLK